MIRPLCLVVCALIPAGCQKLTAAQFVLEPAFPHLTFEQPVEFQFAPDGSHRLFVVEQKGVVRSFLNDPRTKESRVFLDLVSEVHSGHSEEGMPGLAFHPRFKTKDTNPQEAGLESQFVILEALQPYVHRNGGKIAFGPDGYLYIALGDGGSGGDPHNYGQDLTTLLGSILRIDVDRRAPF